MDMRMVGWLFTVSSAGTLSYIVLLAHTPKYSQMFAWLALSMFGESWTAFMTWCIVFLVLGIGLIKKIRIAEILFTCALLARGVLALIAVGPSYFSLIWLAAFASCGVMTGRQYRLDRRSSGCR